MASYSKRKNKGKTVWQYRISYQNELGESKEITKSGFPTKTAAKAAAEIVETEMRESTNIVEADMLFTEYYHNWLTTYKYDLFSRETDKTYKTAENLVIKYFSGLKLKDLTPIMYQKFLNDYSQTRAKTTVQKYHHKISACLKFAFHTGVIKSDVTYKAVIKGKASQPEHEKYIHERELKDLLFYLEYEIKLSYVSRYMLLLQAATGMRLAEVMAITFDSIDFKNQTITINKSWDYKHATGFKDTKNGVHRTIDLDDEIIKRIKPFYDYQRKNSLTQVIKNPLHLLFIDNKASIVTEKAINSSLEAACKRAGIKRITTHALRHTHASILLYHGVDIQIVAERLGDTVETITQVYAHVLDEMRDKNRDLVKEISSMMFA